MKCRENRCSCLRFSNYEEYRLAEAHADFNAIQIMKSAEFDKYILIFIVKHNGKRNKYFDNILNVWEGNK